MGMPSLCTVCRAPTAASFSIDCIRWIQRYKTSRIEKTEEREADDWYKNFNIDFILRAGVVYNNSKYFVGTSFVGRTYDYYKNSFSLNNGFGTLQIYAGFNFYLKKEYRKNKK